MIHEKPFNNNKKEEGKIMEEEGDRRFIFEIEEGESRGFWNITFVAEYRRRLFSDIAGVIALHNVNILSAKFSLWKEANIAEISFMCMT